MKSDRQLKLPQIQKIMQEFEKQSEIMDMKEEMMSDAIDDAMGDEADEEERLIFIQLNVRQYF
jgi:charged multivesicular body protein 2A